MRSAMRTRTQSFVRFAHDTVSGNDNPEAPTGDQGFGTGVVISGGDDDTVQDNVIAGQPLGVVVSNADAVRGSWQATDNRVAANRVSSSSLDLDLLTGATSQGNCFRANRARRMFTARVESVTVCGRSVRLHGRPEPLPTNPPQVNYLKIAAPPAQPTMP